MGVDKIFIELGSFATNIYFIEDGKRKTKPFMNPYNLMDENGDIDILKFKSNVVSQIAGYCEAKDFPINEVRVFATGIYRGAYLSDVRSVLREYGIRQIRIVSPHEECEYGFWSFYGDVEGQQLYSNVKYIDIGGGSVEIGHFVDGEMEKFYGFDFGVLHCLNILLFNTSSGITEAFGRLHHVLDQELEKESLTFEDEGYFSKCIISGSTVKNIDSRFVKDGIVSRDDYEEFIHAKKNELFAKIQNTGYLIRLFRANKEGVRTSLRLILGGEYLLKILDKMEISKFEINRKSFMDFVH